MNASLENPNAENPNGLKLMRLLMFTLILSSMSSLMFNIVLPRISEEFQLSYARVSWLTSGYTIIYAIGTVMYGKLADRFRLKNLLTFGLALFAFGSLAGLFSTTYWMALAARCLQSAGAACIPAMAMIIPTRFIAPERRGQAMGMSAVGLALGTALAPVVSAVIVSVADWRWLFVPPLVLLVLLPLYRRFLMDDDPKGARESFDWLGGGLLAATVALLLLGVTNRDGGLLLAGLAALALFVWRMHAAEQPFVRPALFRFKRYTLALSLSFLIHAIGISLFFLTPKLLDEVYSLDANWIGFAMVPAALVASTLGRAGGKWADRMGNAFLFRIASGLLILCFLLFSGFVGVHPLWISVFLIFGNVGQSFIGVAMSNTISRTLPKEYVGVGMGLYPMMNFIAQGIAMGVYGIAVELDAASDWNPLHGLLRGLDLFEANMAGSSLYSNLFLVLAVLHAGILWLYLSRFRKEKLSAENNG
jgi:DHA2 family metal-tetracycline-proton antiporter-like MFS transporter